MPSLAKKRERTLAHKNFTRNLNQLNNLLDESAPLALIVPQYEKVKKCWESLEDAHDAFLSVVDDSEMDIETDKDGLSFIDDPNDQYNAVVKRCAVVFSSRKKSVSALTWDPTLLEISSDEEEEDEEEDEDEEEEEKTNDVFEMTAEQFEQFIQEASKNGTDGVSLELPSTVIPTVIPPSPPPAKRCENRGRIFFDISYVKQVLVLKIVKGVDLPVNDMNGSSDPYVKVFLLPDKKQKFETRIMKRNLNPVWKETFRFEPIPEEKLLQRSLYLQVFDYDRFTKDDFIGEVEVKLTRDHLQKEPVHLEQELKPCKNHKRHEDLGSLFVSLCYDPTSSNLLVAVIKGSRLKITDVSGKSDPFVKVYLLYLGTKLDKQKTPIVKRSLNPEWNHVMEFEDIAADKLRGISIVFTVMDFDALMPNDYVGKVIVGCSTIGTSLQHWKDVLSNPGKPIAQWHRIVKY